MKYHGLFRKLRERHGLSLSALAARAGCHRNTVINLEKGRPVKFKTIADLMGQMGYESDSPEMSSMALLWVESVSGVRLASSRSLSNARRRVAAMRSGMHGAVEQLALCLKSSGLDESAVDLLHFAAAHPAVLRMIAEVRPMLGDDELRVSPVPPAAAVEARPPRPATAARPGPRSTRGTPRG